VRNFINKALGAARKYSVWDYGVLKICLFSLGILIAAAFPAFVLGNMIVIGVIFVVTYIWLLYKTFFKYWDK